MILDEIVEKTKERIAKKKLEVSLEEIKALTQSMEVNEEFPFEEALRKEEMSFICEVKKASPSKGEIVKEFPYTQIATEYEQAGASAISVLTEPFYFGGKDSYLNEIKEMVSIPVLRKDFTIDEYMIYEAKLLGADAILLICSILTKEELKRYIKLADSLGLSALVETHSKEEILMALACKARIIGVNNRNLKNFKVDLNHSISLRSLVPSEVLFVSESGIKTAKDVAILKNYQVNAVLIGETLMKSADKKKTLEAFYPSTIKENLLRVKICGLRREEDITYANYLKPDYIGFVFAESKRKVSMEEAILLRKKLSKDILVVGVFVNESRDMILEALNRGIIDIAQLHGEESKEDIAVIKEQTKKNVIKAIKVRKPEDILKWQDSKADYLLFDNGEGTGHPFHWEILKQVAPNQLTKPFFLAGGLRMDNVREALAVSKPLVPFGIDVSSGVETNGYKDFEKMKQILNVREEI